MPQFEIQHLSGRRILGSTVLSAKDRLAADRKSKAWRRKQGATRYRIRNFTANKPRHGGYHETAFVFKNH